MPPHSTEAQSALVSKFKFTPPLCRKDDCESICVERGWVEDQPQRLRYEWSVGISPPPLTGKCFRDPAAVRNQHAVKTSRCGCVACHGKMVW